MRIAVVGCGAMGSIFAGLLASAGNDVLVVHHNPEVAARINERGVRVEGASGDRTVRVRAFARPPGEPVDMVVLAVKARQVAEAARACAPLMGARTVVLAMQNGIGSAALAAEALGADRIIVGIAGGFGASLKGPGHAHHHGMEIVRMGPYAQLDFAQVERTAAAWRDAGFATEAVRDIAVMQWEKLICNAAYSALCALGNVPVGQVMDDADVGPLSRAAATEAWHVARASGLALAVQDPIAHARAFGTRMRNSRPSLLQDLEAGRPTEIDFINGAVVREASRLGMQAPVNDTLARLVRARERAVQASRQEVMA